MPVEWVNRRAGESAKRRTRVETDEKKQHQKPNGRIRGDSEETGQAFSRFGCLSKRARNCATCLRVEQEISRRRAICANRSNSSFVSLCLRKHSGGMAQAALHSGIHFQAQRFRKRGRRNASAHGVCSSSRLHR